MALSDHMMSNRFYSRLAPSINSFPAFIVKYNIWICGFYALFLTLKFYPGIFYYDVIWQFNWVEYICKALKAHTFSLPPDITNQWPIWNVFIRIPFFLITKDFGIFILLSVFFFLYSILEIHRKIGQATTFIVTASLFVFSPLAGWLVLHGPHLFVTACLFCFIASQIGGAYWRALIFLVAAILIRPEVALIFFLCALLQVLSRQLPLKAGLATLTACIIVLAASQINFCQGPQIRTMNVGPALVGLYLLSQDPGITASIGEFAIDKSPIDASCSLNMWCPALQSGVDWGKLNTGSTSRILASVAQIIAKKPADAVALMTERTKIFLFRRLQIAELGRPDMLKFANSKIIRDSLTDNVLSLVKRHNETFYPSIFGTIYIPIAFILLPFLFAIPLLNARIFTTSLALAVSVFCFTLVYPTDEIRYYFPEIAWMIVLAPASVVSLVTLLKKKVFARASEPRQDHDMSQSRYPDRLPGSKKSLKTGGRGSTPGSARGH